jgi:hypothetical protein
MAKQRKKSLKIFNGRTLQQYLDDSWKRWNGIIPPRDDLAMDWQSRAFFNFTRNVVLAYLSRVALTMPKAKIKATDENNLDAPKKAYILEKSIEWIRNKQNGEYKFFNIALEMFTKGTVVAYEGFRKQKRKIKEIKKYDPITGKVDYEEKEILDWNDCFQQVIPLEDIYFGNIYQGDIQEQPDIAWVQTLPKKEAAVEFKKYPAWKYVVSGAMGTNIESAPYYMERDQRQSNETVQIVRYFRKKDDTMRILANYVLLYDGPIPFDHKKYPFAHTINEPFAIDCIYGKSGPDKIATEQDIINTFWNMGVDQTYATIYKPILTQDPDYIEEYILQPGKMFQVRNLADYKVMNEMTGPDSSYFNMMNLALKFGNDSSGNLLGGGSMMGGVSKSGKTTARQAMIQDEMAKQLLGLPLKMLEKFQIEDTRLVISNFLQFYVIDQKVDKMTGVTGARQTFLRTMRLDDTELEDGTHGTSIIRIAKNEKSLPSQEDINAEVLNGLKQGQNLEVKVITPDYIRHLDWDVQVVHESSYMQSQSLRQAQALEFANVLSSNPMFAPLLNPDELLRETVKAFGKDTEKLIKQPQEMQQGMQPGMPGQPGQQPPTPQVSSQILGRNQDRSLGSLAGI